jgi:phosphoribosylformylglycinamidine (FGAM) synthase PurS component
MPEKKLNHPQVHQYYKSRINVYGNSMSALIAITALLYSILSINTTIRDGLICLISWTIFITIAYFIALKSQKSIVVNRISDFIMINLDPSDAKLVSNDIDKFVESLLNNHKTQLKFNSKIDDQIQQLYKLYILAETEKLNSSEIKAINENSK